MTGFFTITDRLAGLLVAVATVMLAALICVSLYEVFARYVLAAPTVWAFDMVNFTNGALFVLGAAYAQRERLHVSIDILSGRLPRRLGAAILGALFLLAVLPTIGLLAWEATHRLIGFWQSGRVVESAWHPPRWPFYVPIALGLWALWLQCLATCLRLGLQVARPA
ncbi:TRAP transporter small permease subunit [Cereibacter azotoformans]|uniref:TRAP transporter small permease subunit n=1 Tax=Cereibacter azotoformans TaxID=43057 RepID=UPI000C6D10C2|nr:TRAP transporter small permease subunit [Cereibacter azotoformans]